MRREKPCELAKVLDIVGEYLTNAGALHLYNNLAAVAQCRRVNLAQ